MLFVAVSFCAVGLSSCGGDPKPPSEDTLVLELGGGHGSLRGALLRAGVVIAPRPAAAATSMPSMQQLLGGSGQRPTDPEASGAMPLPEPESEPQPQSVPQSEPEPTPSYREVELRQGETISHLSSIHLGTVRRYHEILELNQWTEEQSRRLAAGTTVKIPVP